MKLPKNMKRGIESILESAEKSGTRPPIGAAVFFPHGEFGVATEQGVDLRAAADAAYRLHVHLLKKAHDES